MHRVRTHTAEIALHTMGDASGEQEKIRLFWGHGWGHSAQQFLPLAEALQRIAPSTLFDFPGFGASPLPDSVWSTTDYADAIAEYMADFPATKRVWIGHSFGCRIGLQLAARHPQLVDGLFLIAAAGLPRRRSLAETIRLKARIWSYKAAKLFVPEGPKRDALRARFGSADYRNAGPLRPIFQKTIAEDLSAIASTIRCPVTLVYGDHDTDTPPEIGTRLSALIPGSKLVLLAGLDHHTILTDGKHQLTHRLNKFIGELLC